MAAALSLLSVSLVSVDLLLPSPRAPRALAVDRRGSPWNARAPRSRLCSIACAIDQSDGMKRADLPSEEELSAVQLLGAAGGAVMLRFVGGSALLGALMGGLIARRVAHEPSKAGAYLREAGWETHQQLGVARTTLSAACVWAAKEAQQLGMPPPRELLPIAMKLRRQVIRARVAHAHRPTHSAAPRGSAGRDASCADPPAAAPQAVAEIRRLDEEHGVSERVATRLSPLTDRARAALERLAAVWERSALSELVKNSGLPDRARRFRERAEERLQQEMRRGDAL